MKEIPKILISLKQKLQNRLGENLIKIILFGSRARGDDTLLSDYDCLVIFNDLTTDVKDDIDEIAGEILYQDNTVVSFIPITKKRYKEEIFNPLFMNVRQEGVVL